MATDSEYGNDVKLLDDLTRLKLRLIDRVSFRNFLLKPIMKYIKQIFIIVA